MRVTSLPLWIQSLLVGYVVPEEVSVKTAIRLGDLRSRSGTTTQSSLYGDLSFPGLIPDFSVALESVPTVTSMVYSMFVKKAVGFYGITFKALDYDKTKFNDWSFPVERRNFGFMAFLKDSDVVEASALHYENQIILADSIVDVLTPVIAYHDPSDLIIKAEGYCCSRIVYQMAREFTYEFSFIPCYEVWEIGWVSDGEPPDDPGSHVHDCATAILSGDPDLMFVYCDSGG